MSDIGSYILWAPTLLVVTARLAGLMLAAPVFAHVVVPVRLRLALAVAAGLAVVAGLAEPVALPPRAVELWILLGAEVLIGLAVGCAARLIFAGVELGAFHVGQQVGLALSDVFDAGREESASALPGLFQMLAVLVFLAVGGHRAMLGGLLATFRTVPPLSGVAAPSILKTVVAVLGASFILALKLAGPVLIAMLLAAVAFGLVQRTTPQFHLLSVELPLRAMLGLAVLAGTLAALVPLMEGAAAGIGRAVEAMTAAR